MNIVFCGDVVLENFNKASRDEDNFYFHNSSTETQF